MGLNGFYCQGKNMNKAQPFKQHSLTRALRAAKAAGMESVEVHLPTGTKIVISGASGDKDLKSAPSASRGGKKRPIGGLAFPAVAGQSGTGRKR
jgi:hypothetical protein